MIGKILMVLIYYQNRVLSLIHCKYCYHIFETLTRVGGRPARPEGSVSGSRGDWEMVKTPAVGLQLTEVMGNSK